ncbi:DNA primase, large subunit family [Actinidia rufa]|uniref:DNA primase, large subunit family n=1 Tax=Actinidia rufa TaxID=165716 RepID=A0A7J0GWY5_9ERIC|nr:DNA primase, large subunit family [Actinidia rufa]
MSMEAFEKLNRERGYWYDRGMEEEDQIWEELIKWFLSMETTLFRYHFQLESPEVQWAVIAGNDLPCKAVSNAKFEISDMIFYKVCSAYSNSHFNCQYCILNLLITKYLPMSSHNFVATFESTCADKQIVEALSTSYLGPDYSLPREFADISLKDIDQVAKSSFPLRMRHLFDKLREDHHLKHGGRMQLVLFLKGVGLKLEDALTFWKVEFSHKSSRKNEILTSSPGTEEPAFREENLRAAIGKMGVGNRAMEDVIDKVQMLGSRVRVKEFSIPLGEFQSSQSLKGERHPLMIWLRWDWEYKHQPKLGSAYFQSGMILLFRMST